MRIRSDPCFISAYTYSYEAIGDVTNDPWHGVIGTLVKLASQRSHWEALALRHSDAQNRTITTPTSTVVFSFSTAAQLTPCPGMSRQ